ncbi:MAG: Zn-dependent protease with chaperone function, partial [Planctomycetota bacterium]
CQFLIILCFVLAWALMMVGGARQWRESQASWTRFAAITFAFATLAQMPLMMAIVLGLRFDGIANWVMFSSDFGYYSRPWFDGLVDSPWQVSAGAVGVAFIANSVWVARSLQSHRSLFRALGKIPDVEDPDRIERLRLLSDRVGIAMPRVYILKSTSSSLMAMAWAGGIFGNFMTVSDGIWEDLSRDEGDGILAHEMGHLKRRSSLSMVAVMVMATTVATFLSIWIPSVLAMLLMVVFMQGFLKIFSHFDEPMADNAGAEAVGFSAMVHALKVVHCKHVRLSSKMWTRLFHATQSHPSMNERFAHLGATFPGAEHNELVKAQVEARRQCLVNRSVTLAWILFVGLACWMGPREGYFGLSIGVLVCLLLAPVLIRIGAAWKEALVKWRTAGTKKAVFWRLTMIACGGAAFYFLVESLLSFEGSGGFVKPALFGTIWIGVYLSNPGRLPKKIARLYFAQKFDELLIEIPKLSKRVQRRTIVHHVYAISFLCLDRIPEGLESLKVLIERCPNYANGFTWYAKYAKFSDPESALVAAERARELCPKMVLPECLLAVIHLRLGNFEKSMAHAKAAISLDENDAEAERVAAQVFLKSGRVAEAAMHRTRSLALQPADIGNLKLDVSFALIGEDWPVATAKLEELKLACASNIHARMGPDIREFEAMLPT